MSIDLRFSFAPLMLSLGALAALGCAADQPSPQTPAAPRVQPASEPPVATLPSSLPTESPPTTPAAPGTLTPERAVHFRRIGDIRFSPDGSRVVCLVSEVHGPTSVTHLWLADVRRGTLRQVTSSAKSEREPAWTPDGRSIVFRSNRDGSMQLYVMPLDGGEATALTQGDEDVSDFRLSPNGKQVAFLSAEPHPSEKADAPRVMDREQDLDRLWVLDIGSKTPRQLTHGALRIDDFAWLDADHLAVAASEKPRLDAWNDALYRIAVADGSRTPLATPAQPFEGVLASPRGSQVAYTGTRASGPIPHDLFLQSAAGGAPSDVSASIDRAVLDMRWQDERTIVARVAEGFQNVLYRIGPTGAPTLIPLPYSVRSFDVAKDGAVAFAGVGFDHLAELYVKTSGGPVRPMGHLQDEAWNGITLTPAETFRFKSFDGTSIEAALLKPVSAASTSSHTKLPLVLLAHGGPNGNFSAEYYWFASWAQLLVAHGYEVLLVNPRGSTGYGEAFAKADRADEGGGDYKDLLAALDVVLARGETDPQRLGIGGWSYGGQMTEWAIGHTTRFKAAVAGAGVYDQAAEFETENGAPDDEWQFGTPWEHPDVFARNSPSTFIGSAKTPTLIVHGDADKNNPIGQSLGLYRALKHLGVETQLVVYPGEPHLPRQVSHQIDILHRMLDWYDGHLK